MNPVLRDSLRVFFVEGHGLPIYFYLLVILGPVEFLSLYMPTLGAQMWTGPGNLFAICASLAVLMIIYFAVRVANQEYAPRRFKPLEHWLREAGHPAGVVAEGRVAFLVVNVAALALLCAPLLTWAAAIARAPLSALAATLALILFHAFCYGVWGLVALVLWEREQETREVAIRCFIIFLAVASLVVYLPLNPVIYLLAIAGQRELEPFTIGALNWSADSFHLGFHLVLGGAGLATYRRALGRRLEAASKNPI